MLLSHSNAQNGVIRITQSFSTARCSAPGYVQKEPHQSIITRNSIKSILAQKTRLFRISPIYVDKRKQKNVMSFPSSHLSQAFCAFAQYAMQFITCRLCQIRVLAQMEILMAAYHLDGRLAQVIVDRTMRIIDSNVNVMDNRGRIIGSGDQDRIGELHEGALLAILQERIVEIDEAATHNLHGVKPGVNLPLRVEGNIVGAIGLTGSPKALRRYGELVCMTAEMMLEQARLMHMLAQNTRLREELVLNLIHAEKFSPPLIEWAPRLGIDLNLQRVVVVVEVDSGQLGVESAMEELQHLQTLLLTSERDNLIAIVSLSQMVVLKPALNARGRWDPDLHRQKLQQLLSRMSKSSQLKIRLALGNYFPDDGGIARSYRTARTTMAVGKQRMPDQRSYFYQDMVLPVLLDSLRGGWQAYELVRPLAKLRGMDGNGLLRRTLDAWFANNVQPSSTAKALFIHRNTLEYRLTRISDLTGLNLSNFDDRLLLYIALQLDNGKPERAMAGQQSDLRLSSHF